MEFKQLSPPVQQDLPSVSGTTRAIMPTLADGTSDRVKATGGNDEPEANENDNNAMNDDNEEERKAAAGESEPTSNTITYRCV